MANSKGQKFIIATCLDGEKYNEKFMEALSSLKSDKNAVVVDISAMNQDTLKKFADNGYIDCYLFSADSLANSRNKDTMISVLKSDLDNKQNIKFLNVYDSQNDQSKKRSEDIGSMLLDDFNSSITHLDVNQVNLFSQSIRGARNDRLKTKEQIRLNEDQVFDLARNIVSTIENEKDEYTAKHVKSVMQISTVLAQKLGFSQEEIDIIKVGSLLHDIGKLDVATEVLQKKERLTDDEFKEMKSHVVFGEAELARYDLGDYERAKYLIDQHHEKYDGSGYPRGLKGEEIDKLARVLSIADSSQAMFGRAYNKKTKTKDEIVAELRMCAGTQFDPNMVDIMVDILEKEPESIGVNYDKDGKVIWDTPDVSKIRRNNSANFQEQLSDAVNQDVTEYKEVEKKENKSQESEPPEL